MVMVIFTASAIIGSANLMGTLRPLTAESLHLIATLGKQGTIPVLMAVNGVCRVLFALADTLKDDAIATVQALQERKITVVMLTGDNRHTATAIAQQCGIERFYAEVLPSQKVATVRQLKKEGAVVAMVGDGINDAPALVAADLGLGAKRIYYYFLKKI